MNIIYNIDFIYSSLLIYYILNINIFNLHESYIESYITINIT